MIKINPNVSVIIPTYNRAHLAGRIMDSFLKNSQENVPNENIAKLWKLYIIIKDSRREVEATYMFLTLDR